MTKDDDDIPFVRPEMGIEECRAILSSNGEQYTDKEVEEIRAYLMVLVEIDFRYYWTCWKQNQIAATVIVMPPATRNDTQDKAA